MSVILYTKAEVYQQLADAYEGLKHLWLEARPERDQVFYKSLRRLYFANVAAYLSSGGHLPYRLPVARPPQNSIYFFFFWLFYGVTRLSHSHQARLMEY